MVDAYEARRPRTRPYVDLLTAEARLAAAVAAAVARVRREGAKGERRQAGVMKEEHSGKDNKKGKRRRKDKESGDTGHFGEVEKMSQEFLKVQPTNTTGKEANQVSNGPNETREPGLTENQIEEVYKEVLNNVRD